MLDEIEGSLLEIDEMMDDELSDYSLRLSNWRKKYNWKYFAEGGERSDKPFKD